MLRLLQACETSPLSDRLTTLAEDLLAGHVTRAAMSALAEHGRDRGGSLATLAARAVAGLADPETVVGSLVSLVEDLLVSYQQVRR